MFIKHKTLLRRRKNRENKDRFYSLLSIFILSFTLIYIFFLIAGGA